MVSSMGGNVLALLGRGGWVTLLGIMMFTFATGLPKSRIVQLLGNAGEIAMVPEDWSGVFVHLGLVIVLVMISGLYAG